MQGGFETFCDLPWQPQQDEERVVAVGVETWRVGDHRKTGRERSHDA